MSGKSVDRKEVNEGYYYFYLFLKQSICPTQENSVFGERFFFSPLSFSIRNAVKLIVHLNSFLTVMN